MPQVRIDDDVYELMKARAKEQKRTIQAQINVDLKAKAEEREKAAK